MSIGVCDPASPVKKLEPTEAGFSISAAIRRAETHALEHLERQSHRNARGIFQLHVIDAFPAIAGLPADSVTTDDFVTIIRKLDAAGKGRTGNKLRSQASEPRPKTADAGSRQHPCRAA